MSVCFALFFDLLPHFFFFFFINVCLYDFSVLSFTLSIKVHALLIFFFLLLPLSGKVLRMMFRKVEAILRVNNEIEFDKT